MKKTISVKLIRSLIAEKANIKNSVIGLGLKKIGDTKQLENTSSVRGMIKKAIHLLVVQE